MASKPPIYCATPPKTGGARPGMYTAWQPARARHQSHTPGRMNKTEAAYAFHLDLLLSSGEILGWTFESVKLRLADLTWYTPDFLVQLPSREMEFHEVKGFWRDDARVKIKVAAETFPAFHFLAVQRRAKKAGGGWAVERLGDSKAPIAATSGQGE